MNYRYRSIIALIVSLFGVSNPFTLLKDARLTATRGKPLEMAKKIRNKQAEMLRKLKQARDQNKDDSAESTEASSSTKKRISDEEMKERNDRKRFEELLNSQTSSMDYNSDGYLNKEQEMEEIDAARKGVDRLFEGDPAPDLPFKHLVSIQTGNEISDSGAQRIVPWLRKARQDDYLLVLSEPRLESPELRETLMSLLSLPSDVLSRMIVINADSPAANRRWLKKNEGLNGKIEIYSDEKKEWMRAYTALGEDRLSMTLFLLSEGRVQKLVREVDVYAASRVIRNAIKSFEQESRI